jgi:hypothetical protein
LFKSKESSPVFITPGAYQSRQQEADRPRFSPARLQFAQLILNKKANECGEYWNDSVSKAHLNRKQLTILGGIS